MPINFDLKKYLSEVFIETGTFYGAGVRKALEAGFNEIYSIEIDPEKFKHCSFMFRGNPKVHLILGDSTTELPKLLSSLTKRCTFWIDAHYSGEGGKMGAKWSPIKEELEAIKSYKVKDNIIIVDDWDCMDNTHVDKSTHKEVGFPGKDNLLTKLKEINPLYDIKVENNHVFAVVQASK